MADGLPDTSKKPNGGEGSSRRGRSRGRQAADDVPIGNSPPMPRWPLVAFGLAWLAWVGFLFVITAIVVY